jgi:hypothetical protein
MWVEDASYLCDTLSKSQRPARPYLTVGPEALYHHIPLGLVFPEIPKDLFLIWIVLTNSLQTSFYLTLDIGRIES